MSLAQFSLFRAGFRQARRHASINMTNISLPSLESTMNIIIQQVIIKQGRRPCRPGIRLCALHKNASTQQSPLGEDTLAYKHVCVYDYMCISICMPQMYYTHPHVHTCTNFYAFCFALFLFQLILFHVACSSRGCFCSLRLLFLFLLYCLDE